MYAGTWRIARAGGRATLTVETFEPLRPADRHPLEIEGARLLDFAAGGFEPVIVMETLAT